MMEIERVYHASSAQGLEVINPFMSSHGESLVYATADPLIAAVFLGRKGGDLTCAVGRDSKTKKVYICERFQDALSTRYDLAASIYTLSSEGFIEGFTGWKEEVVCKSAVNPISEIKISNAKDYLEELENEGLMIIKKYPERFPWIPEDDQDLVQKMIRWYGMAGPIILKNVKEYQPNLLSAIEQKLGIIA